VPRPITLPQTEYLHIISQIGQCWIGQGVISPDDVRPVAPALMDDSGRWTRAQWDTWYAQAET
jgi:hypothetical protein